MATFTVSQLNSKESGYTLQDADLLVASIGSSNADLSSVNFGILATTSTGLQTGDLFTQTGAQLGGSGSTKVLCIV